MTRNKAKPRGTVGRKGVPIQVYVSKREHARLTALARRSGRTVSQLFRDWLNSASSATAAAAVQQRLAGEDWLRRALDSGRAGHDPRQLEIE